MKSQGVPSFSSASPVPTDSSAKSSHSNHERVEAFILIPPRYRMCLAPRVTHTLAQCALGQKLFFSDLRAVAKSGFRIRTATVKEPAPRADSFTVAVLISFRIG